MPNALAVPIFRITDSNGDPISGAKAYFYATGTTTPQSVYTTSALSVAHPNPVVANSAGTLPPIFLDYAKTYRLVVKDADDIAIPNWDIDPVNSLSSAEIQFTQSGVGSTTRSVLSRLRDDMHLQDKLGGTTDMLTALNSVFTDYITGGICEVQKGTWSLSGTATFAGNRIHLRGAGAQVSIVSFNPAVADVAFEINNPAAGGCAQFSISGFGFASTNSIDKTAIRLVNVADGDVRDVASTASGWLGSGSIGIKTEGRQFVRIRDSGPACARPVVIGANAAFPSLAADHFLLDNLDLVGTSSQYHCIEFENGVSFSSTTINKVALAGGKDGIRWKDTSSPAASFALDVVNCRSEQAVAHTATVTGVTKASPAVVTVDIGTATAHTFETGDTVSFASVGGMTELNGNTYLVGAVTATTFELQSLAGVNTDSTGFTTYTSGGTATGYGYFARLESTAQSLQNLRLSLNEIGLDRNGLRLRNCARVTIENTQFNQTGKIAIDMVFVPGSVLEIINCTGAGQFNLTNARCVRKRSDGRNLGFSETWVYSANSSSGMVQMDTPLGGIPFTLGSGTVTGVTRANPGVVTTSAAHGYATGDVASFTGVVGMTELNGNSYTVTVLTSTTFSIGDTSGNTAYTSGGTTAGVAKITDDTFAGYVDTISIEDVGSRYFLRGGTHSVSERDDPDSFFSATKDNPTTINVYWGTTGPLGSAYKIQNNRGSAKTFAALRLGSNIGA